MARRKNTAEAFEILYRRSRSKLAAGSSPAAGDARDASARSLIAPAGGTGAAAGEPGSDGAPSASGCGAGTESSRKPEPSAKDVTRRAPRLLFRPPPADRLLRSRCGPETLGRRALRSLPFESRSARGARGEGDVSRQDRERWLPAERERPAEPVDDAAGRARGAIARWLPSESRQARPPQREEPRPGRDPLCEWQAPLEDPGTGEVCIRRQTDFRDGQDFVRNVGDIFSSPPAPRFPLASAALVPGGEAAAEEPGWGDGRPAPPLASMGSRGGESAHQRAPAASSLADGSASPADARRTQAATASAAAESSDVGDGTARDEGRRRRRRRRARSRRRDRSELSVAASAPAADAARVAEAARRGAEVPGDASCDAAPRAACRDAEPRDAAPQGAEPRDAAPQGADERHRVPAPRSDGAALRELRRAARWLLGDGLTRALAQRVEFRVGTVVALVMAALIISVLAIVYAGVKRERAVYDGLWSTAVTADSAAATGVAVAATPANETAADDDLRPDASRDGARRLDQRTALEVPAPVPLLMPMQDAIAPGVASGQSTERLRATPAGERQSPPAGDITGRSYPPSRRQVAPASGPEGAGAKRHLWFIRVRGMCYEDEAEKVSEYFATRLGYRCRLEPETREGRQETREGRPLFRILVDEPFTSEVVANGACSELKRRAAEEPYEKAYMGNFQGAFVLRREVSFN